MGSKHFSGLTKRVKGHNKPEIAGTPSAGCKDAKELLILVGSIEVKTLFNHIGGVAEADSWEEALNKVSRGIVSQTSQAVATLLQTGDKKLQWKRLSKNLNYTNTIKYRSSLEQIKKEIAETISSRGRPENTKVAEHEDEVKSLGKQTDANICNTFTRRPTGGAHNKGACPGKKVECYSCRLMGHLKGAIACKERSARKQKANHISDLEEKGNTGDKIC